MSLDIQSSIDAERPHIDNTSSDWVADWSIEALQPERISELIGELTPSDEIRQGRNLGVHIVDGSNPLSDIARFIEWKNFEVRFKNDIGKMKEMYEPYDEASTFLIIVDYENQKPVGNIRIVKPVNDSLITIDAIVAPNSLWKSQDDSPEKRKLEMGYDPDHTVDITTMAVMPEYSSGHSKDGASAVLYSTCVRWSLANGYNHWATIVDSHIYNMMQAWGEPFTPFEGTDFEPFEGSKASIPVYTDLYTGLEKVKAFSEDIYDLYTKSSGLEFEYVLPEID